MKNSTVTAIRYCSMAILLVLVTVLIAVLGAGRALAQEPQQEPVGDETNVVVANFAGTPTSGPAPLLVTFTNSSQQATGYLWNYGDGSTSTISETNHTYLYLNSGVYTVTLQASNSEESATLARINFITVVEALDVNFTASPRRGTGPLQVNFTNQSTGASEYLWDFGDGQTSTETHPSHLYTQTGHYTVTLRATSAYQVNAEKVKVAYVAVNPAPTGDRVDLDRDGYPDLVISNYYSGSSYNTNSYIYWGSPTGYNEAARTALPTSGAWSNAVADLNRDGHLDIVFANSYNMSSHQINSYIYWGNGTRTGFSAANRTSLPTLGGWAVAVADLNWDGYLDLVFANHTNGTTFDVSSYIYWNGPAGFSTANRTSLPTRQARAVDVADLDMDGYFDLVFANYCSGTCNLNSYIYWGSPTGYSSSLRTDLPTQGALDVGIVDLNNDRALDLVFANSNNGSSYSINSFVYWGNNSQSGFSPGNRTELPTVGAIGQAAADLNRDGFLDLVFANNYNGTTYDVDSYIYWGGSDKFNPARREQIAVKGAASVLAADIDGDGWFDLYFTQGNVNEIHWNSPSGFYTTNVDSLPGLAPRGVSLVRPPAIDTVSFGRVTTDPPGSGLKLSKTAPATAVAGEPITYTLTLTNFATTEVTNLVITDTLPVGAHYVDGGTRDGNLVRWDVPALAPGQALSVTFTVTAATTLINRDYAVTADEDRWAAGWPAVTTQVYPPVRVDFSAQPLSGRAPLTVTFTNLSTGAASFLWNYGDGSTSTSVLASHTHTYANPGVYTVTLRASNAITSTSLTRTGYIIVLDSAGPDLSASQMVGSLSRVRQGNILTYTVLIRNDGSVVATAVLSASVPAYTVYVPGSASASDGSPVTWDGTMLRWSGRVAHGTPVIIEYAVTVQEAPAGAEIVNAAYLDDGAGQVTPLQTTAIYDPLFRLTINDGALYTNSPNVILTLSWGATNPPITTMWLSNDGGFGSETQVLPVVGRVGWMLSTYGQLVLPRTVYAVFFDQTGNDYGPIQDDIIYDPDEPELEVEMVTRPVAAGQPSALGDQRFVRVTNRDDNSGVEKAMLSDTPDFSSAATVSYPVTGAVQEWPWPHDGSVYVQVIDRAGNTSVVKQAGGAGDFKTYLPLLLQE